MPGLVILLRHMGMSKNTHNSLNWKTFRAVTTSTLIFQHIIHTITIDIYIYVWSYITNRNRILRIFFFAWINYFPFNIVTLMMSFQLHFYLAKTSLTTLEATMWQVLIFLLHHNLHERKIPWFCFLYSICRCQIIVSSGLQNIVSQRALVLAHLNRAKRHRLLLLSLRVSAQRCCANCGVALVSIALRSAPASAAGWRQAASERETVLP